MKLAAWPRAFAACSSSSVERADPREELELVAEVRTHHLGAVRGDREGDAVLDERAECVAHSGPRPASAFVSRLDVGQISSTMPASRSRPISSGSLGREDPVADAVGAEELDHLADLLGAGLAFLADVDRHPESRLARRLDHRRDGGVVVAAPTGPRAGDVDPDDTAVGPARSPSPR